MRVEELSQNKKFKTYIITLFAVLLILPFFMLVLMIQRRVQKHAHPHAIIRSNALKENA
jgi:hypothetical protein